MDEKQMIIEIVNYIIACGTQNTTSGSWIIYADELQEIFNINYEWIHENVETIKDEINGREEILSETWDELDENGKWIGFNCNFCGMYCSNWEEKGEFE